MSSKRKNTPTKLAKDDFLHHPHENHHSQEHVMHNHHLPEEQGHRQHAAVERDQVQVHQRQHLTNTSIERHDDAREETDNHNGVMEHQEVYHQNNYKVRDNLRKLFLYSEICCGSFSKIIYFLDPLLSKQPSIFSSFSVPLV